MVTKYVGFVECTKGIGAKSLFLQFQFATMYLLTDNASSPTWSLYQCQASSLIGSPTEPITFKELNGKRCT